MKKPFSTNASFNTSVIFLFFLLIATALSCSNYCIKSSNLKQMYVLEHIFRHYDTQTCIINKYVIHLQPKKQQNNNPINKERFLKRLFIGWF